MKEGFLAAFDLTTGTERWRVPRAKGLAWSTPTVWTLRNRPAQLVVNSARWIRRYDPATGSERPIIAVRANARGEQALTPGTTIAWIVERGAPYLATPLVYQGLLYVCAGNGVLSVYRVETGALVYRSRLSDTPATFSASPVAANGFIYFASDECDVVVLRASERFERVAVNRMNEPCFATPAISGDALFIRTARQLFAIGS